VDYKKEIVPLKKNTYYVISDKTAELATEEMKKADVKINIKFEDSIFEGGNASKQIMYVHIYTGSTGKKPMSEVTTLTVHGYSDYDKYADISNIKAEDGYNQTKNRYKLPKGYEVYDKGKGKWVTSVKIPKTTQSSKIELNIRVRGTAKYDAKRDDNLKLGTYTTSETKTLVIPWGIVDEKKNKYGVIDKVTVEEH